MFTRKTASFGVLCAITFLSGLAACEHRVETVKTTETPNGTEVRKETTVQHDDGTVTKTEEKSETRTDTH